MMEANAFVLAGQESFGRDDALDRLNKNQLADLKSHDRATLCEV